MVSASNLDVIDALNDLAETRQWRGFPEAIRCDNRPDFPGQTFVNRCEEHPGAIRYIQPGNRNQNACLFETLGQRRRVTRKWLPQDNEERPPDALGSETPTDYREALEAGLSTFELSA